MKSTLYTFYRQSRDSKMYMSRFHSLEYKSIWDTRSCKKRFIYYGRLFLVKQMTTVISCFSWTGWLWPSLVSVNWLTMAITCFLWTDWLWSSLVSVNWLTMVITCFLWTDWLLSSLVSRELIYYGLNLFLVNWLTIRAKGDLDVPFAHRLVFEWNTDCTVLQCTVYCVLGVGDTQYRYSILSMLGYFSDYSILSLNTRYCRYWVISGHICFKM